MVNCINTNTEEFKSLATATNLNPKILAAKISLWQENNGLDKYPTLKDLSKKEEVNYNLKAINILSTDKAEQVFAKGRKANWPLEKIFTELQIPKEQKQLILNLSNDVSKTKNITESGLIAELKKVIPQNEAFAFAINSLPNKKEINYKDIKTATFGLPLERYFNKPENIDKEIGSAYKIYNYLKEGGTLPDNTLLLDSNNKIQDGNNRLKAQLALGKENYTYVTTPKDFFTKSPYQVIAEEYLNNNKEVISKINALVPSLIPSDLINQLILDLIANYSYAVEINVAGDIPSANEYGNQDYFESNGKYFYLSPQGENIEITKEEYDQQKIPTKYHSNLTVPGGTNYTENAIQTPNILNISAAHTEEFSKGVSNMLGWFRSDEQRIGGTSFEEVDAVTSQVVKTTHTGELTKTRRILEVQSDLFQKGRDKKDLIGNENLLSIAEKTFTHNNVTYRPLINQDDNGFHIVENGVNNSIPKSELPQEVMDWAMSLKSTLTSEKTKLGNSNQFLQLLNKDNNWISFFVKSIVQDSAKKGYEKVLFPSGETAAKVEGHTTLAEQAKQINKEIEKAELFLKQTPKEREDILKEKIVEEKKNIEKNVPEINEIEKEIKAIKDAAVFLYQEPGYNGPGREGFTYARIQNTESPIRKGDHADKLPKDYKGYYVFAYTNDRNALEQDKVIPISNEEAKAAWIAEGSAPAYSDQQHIFRLEDKLRELRGAKLQRLEQELSEVNKDYKVEGYKQSLANAIKQKQRLETEGFAKLKPIEYFYATTVTNILNKQYGKENVKQVIDEYGNTWNEIDVLAQESSNIDLAFDDQLITPNDKVVFGHPTIGKSFLKDQGDDRFISLDDDYSAEINSRVKEISDKYEVTTYMVKDGGTEGWNKEYNQMMQKMFDVAKQRAISENKTLFTSNTNLLVNNQESFDKVINLSDEEFEKRIKGRGARYDTKEWKSQINAAISKFPSNKVINTDKYLSDLFMPLNQVPSIDLAFDDFSEDSLVDARNRFSRINENFIAGRAMSPEDIKFQTDIFYSGIEEKYIKKSEFYPSYTFEKNNQGQVTAIKLEVGNGRMTTKRVAFKAATERAKTINDAYVNPSFRSPYLKVARVTPLTDVAGYKVELRPTAFSMVIGKYLSTTPNQVTERLMRAMMSKLLLTNLLNKNRISKEQFHFLRKDFNIDLNPGLTDTEIANLASIKVEFAGGVVDGNMYLDVEDYRQAILNREQEFDMAYEIADEDELNFDTAVDPIKLEKYIDKKREQVKTLTNKIVSLESSRATAQRKKEIGNQIAVYKAIRTRLEREIESISNGESTAKVIKNYFDQDVKTIKELLTKPTLSNVAIAREMLHFLIVNTSYVTQDTKENVFVGQENQISTEITKIMSDLLIDTNNLKVELQKATSDIFVGLLDKVREPLLDLFPGRTIEEIKDIILQRINYSQVDAAVGQVLPHGVEMEIENLLAQYERLEYGIQESLSKVEIAPFIQAIDGVLNRVTAKLKELGHTFGSNVDFNSAFTTKLKNGDLVLVSVFSPKWNEFLSGVNSQLKDVMKKAYSDPNATDHAAVNKGRNDKYLTLKQRANLIDFRQLEDVFTIGNFGQDSIITTMQGTFSNALKQRLIQEIGETEYEEFIYRQIQLLEEYEVAHQQRIDTFLDEKNVSTVNGLTFEQKTLLDYRLNTHNPAYLLELESTGQDNKVPINVGGQVYTSAHSLEYNVFLPKMTEKDFIDQKFDAIRKDAVLLEAWKALNNAIIKINENYSTNSKFKLNRRSIFFMAKGFKEEFIDHGFYTKNLVIRPRVEWANLKQFIKDAFSSREQIFNERSEITLPEADLQSFKQRVLTKFKEDLITLNTIVGGLPFTKNQKIALDSLTFEQKESMFELFDVENETEFRKLIYISKKDGTFSIGGLKSLTQAKIYQEQTFDLPTVLKAQLEMSAEHKARTVMKSVMDSVTIPLNESVYEKGPNIEEGVESQTVKNARTYAQNKQLSFYKMVVLNKRSTSHWGKMFSKQAKNQKIEPKEWLKFLGEHYYKNLKAEDKKLIKIYNERLTQYEELLLKFDPTIPEDLEAIEAINSDKAEIEAQIENMGSDYTFGAMYESLGVGALVKVKLAFNTGSAIFNKIAGTQQGLKKAGFIDPITKKLVGDYSLDSWNKASAFIGGAFTAKIGAGASYLLNKAGKKISPSAYAKQVETMAIFIDALGVVNDGTNVMQRAERVEQTKAPSFFSMNHFKKIMYLTELVEYNNQVPTILAMMQHQYLEDGTTPIFDGVSFPAHEIIEGKLTLKPQFRTPENIAKWETLSDMSTLLWMQQIKDALNKRNGDYSTRGAIQAKATSVGKAIMAFGAWLPMLLHSAWHKDQKNLVSGENQVGYMRALATNPKLRGFGVGIMAQQTGIRWAMGGSMVMAGSLYTGALPIVMLGSVLYGLFRFATNKNSVPSVPVNRVATGKRVAKILLSNMTTEALRGVIDKIGTNANLISGGRLGYKGMPEIDYTFGGELNSREALSLKIASKQQAMMAFYTYLLVGACLIFSGGDDDEEELQGEWGSEQRRLYDLQKENEEKNDKAAQIKRMVINAIQRAGEDISSTTDIQEAAFTLIGKEDDQILMPQVEISQGLFYAANDLIASIPGSPLDKKIYGQKGVMYSGDSWSSVMFRKSLPAPLRNIDKDEYKLGLESMSDRIFNQTSPILQAFSNTDLKKDRKAQRKEREQEKVSLENGTEYQKVLQPTEISNLEFKYGEVPDYEDLPVNEKEQIDSKIKDYLKDFSTFDRSKYDENQNLIK